MRLQNFLYELTCLPDDAVKKTPPPSHDDRRGIVTMIDKHLRQTSKNENL